MENLTGNFLIATTRMPDPRFNRQVIYMCAHTDDGAMGLVINHPSTYTLTDIMNGAEIPVTQLDLPPVYLGGPVEMEAGFFLYSADYETDNYIGISPTVSLSRDPEILWSISRGHAPERYIFALGYAGWGPGQLEGELKVNGWLTLPSDDKVLFDTPDELKWEMAASKHGIDISTFDDLVGFA